MITQSWLIIDIYIKTFWKKLFLPSFMIIFEITICSMIVSMDFWKDHSTEYAAMELTDKILKAIDDKKYFTGNLYLDHGI